MEPPAPPPAAAPDRYSRQARFGPVGAAGQARLRAARVAVVGCGALGCAAVDLLARAGVGTLVVADRDFVELSNLQRQVLFDEADAAAQAPKAVAAAAAVARINAEVRVEPHVVDVGPGTIEGLLAGAQVVVDGTDNFETRYLLNDACHKLGLPWVHGAAIGASGVVMTVVPGETPCLRCVYPGGQPAGALATCETAGVLGPIVTLVAAAQVAEVLKLLVGDRAHRLEGLATFDLWTNDHLVATGFERRPGCPCCALRRFDYLEARATSQTTALCGRSAVQVSPASALALDLPALGRRLAEAGPVTVTPWLVRFAVGEQELTVFADGRAIVKGTSDPGLARSLYARYVGA